MKATADPFDWQIIATLPNGQEITLGGNRDNLPALIENFHECLTADGRFAVRGTKFFWCRAGETHLYHMTAYGGYESGGRGCFYVDLENNKQ